MYLVYIIVCDNLYYIGMTNDFFHRLSQHNGIISGGAKYTKKKNNWYPICIIDGFKTKSEAIQCEWKFKTKKNKLSRQNKGIIGRLKYLDLLLVEDRWTSHSPLIKDQCLQVYVDEDYTKYINNVEIWPLYWK